MAIEELKLVVPPPAQPLEVGSDKAWKAIERQMKIKFPQDYREFISTYGSGRFVFDESGRVEIFNPFVRLFHENVLSLCENYRAFQIGEGKKNYPYEVWPEKGGIIALGIDDLESGVLYWIPKGKPDDWAILHCSRDNVAEEFHGPLTSFLARAFRYDRIPAIWTEVLDHQKKLIEFVPEATPPEPEVYPTTIRDLYMDNHNKCGFWVKTATGGNYYIYYLIKTIGGRTEGVQKYPFDETIIADSYFNGKLVGLDVDLTGMRDHPVFFLTEPPQGLDR